MGEIDDWYKQEEERIEDEYFENLKKKGADANKCSVEYKKNLDSLKIKFEDKSGRKLKTDMKKAQNPVHKKEKKEKFERLKIDHFDFKFNWWQRKKRLWSFKLFRINRRRKLFVEKSVPENLVYFWYKTKKTFGVIKRDFDDIFEGITESIKTISTRAWEKTTELSKKYYVKAKAAYKKALGKLSRKKIEKKEGGDGGENGESHGESDESNKGDGSEKKE